jgi:hypothetical protein
MVERNDRSSQRQCLGDAESSLLVDGRMDEYAGSSNEREEPRPGHPPLESAPIH